MKMNIRKMLCFVLTLCISFSCIVPVFAAEADEYAPMPYNNEVNTYAKSSSNVTDEEIAAAAADGLTIIEKITNPIVIQQMIRDGLAEVDENGNLPTSIVTYRTRKTDGDIESNVPNVSRATGITVTKTNYYDGQYFDDYDRYVIDGPAQFETSYRKTGKYNWNTSMTSNMSVGGKVYKVADVKAAVSSTVGYSFDYEEEQSQKYTGNVPDGKYWVIKVYVSYLVYEYTAKVGTTTLATGKTWKPNGLVITKTEYNQS